MTTAMAEHPENALAPMYSTVSGMLTYFKLLLFRKTSLSMAVTT